jgi:hypothetical protein
VARPALGRAVEIVDDVDAADERGRAVDHRKLAVHAAQTPAAQTQPREFRPEGQHPRAGAAQHVAETRRKVARAEAVDQQMHAHAARRRAGQRVRHQATGLVVGKDVAFQEHLFARRIDGAYQRGKILLAVLQQRQKVAADILHR